MKARSLTPLCFAIGALAFAANAHADYNPTHPGLSVQVDAKYTVPENRVSLGMAPIGDVTGDGRVDFLAELPSNGRDNGDSFWLMPGSDRRGAIPLTPRGGARSLKPTGGADPIWRVFPVGDVSGDGVDDIAIMRYDEGVGQFNAVDEIVLGGPGFVERVRGATSPITITKTGRGEVNAYPAGDVDGDGVNDVMLVHEIERTLKDPDGGPAIGSRTTLRAIVLHGGSSMGPIDLDALPADVDVLTLPEDGYYGNHYFAAGDIDGDGKSDLVGNSEALDAPKDQLVSPRVLTVLTGGARGRRAVAGGPGVHSISLPVPQLGARMKIADVNGDGIGDVTASAHSRWVMFGSATLPTSFDHRNPAPGSGESFGGSGVEQRPTFVFSDRVNFDGTGAADAFAPVGSAAPGLVLNAFDGRSVDTPRQSVVYANGIGRTFGDINGDGADDIVMGLSVIFGGTRPPACIPWEPSKEEIEDLQSGISRKRAIRVTGPRRETEKPTVAQLRENQQAASDAIRRLNAIRDWLDAGIEGRDICGDALDAEHLAPGVTAPTQAPIARTAPDPRPLNVAEPGEAGDVQLTRNQLLINQRIYQAAIARANALTQRMQALTGGDIADGSLDTRALRAELGRPAGASAPVAASVTLIKKPKNKNVTGLEMTPVQVEINYTIALEVLRRARNLQGRIETGLIGQNFAPGSIGTADLAPAG